MPNVISPSVLADYLPLVIFMGLSLVIGGALLLTPFVVAYKARGARMLQTDTLVGVEVKDFEVGWDQGAKNMDITLPIVFLKLLAA